MCSQGCALLCVLTHTRALVCVWVLSLMCLFSCACYSMCALTCLLSFVCSHMCAQAGTPCYVCSHVCALIDVLTCFLMGMLSYVCSHVVAHMRVLSFVWSHTCARSYPCSHRLSPFLLSYLCSHVVAHMRVLSFVCSHVCAFICMFHVYDLMCALECGNWLTHPYHSLPKSTQHRLGSLAGIMLLSLLILVFDFAYMSVKTTFQRYPNEQRSNFPSSSFFIFSKGSVKIGEQNDF